MTSDSICPECGAKYKIVRILDPPGPDERAVPCLQCGHHLPPRHEEFLLKYFLTERPKPGKRS
jgi:predicted Zn finger-like uncharacterized protein